ncbi:hypothetical protein CF120_07580 [Aeromonas allosaccharophila]|nr:hypothetical protein CF120_07580 [Aeromonas allosaccharophila]
MPQIPRLASLGNGAEGNHRPHYSADWQRGIVPSQSLRTSKPATLFPTTPTTPNKIKGHKNPNANTYYFLS